MAEKRDIDGDAVEREEVNEKLFHKMDQEGVSADSPDGRVMAGYGEPYKYDPDFNGPIENRSCTDIICCILFILFMLGMAIISIIGFARGDPKRLIYPTDSYGDICGVGDLEDKPFLFFFDLVECAKMGPSVVTGCPTPQVCVKECPKENHVHLENDRSSLICRYRVDPNADPYKDMSVKDLVDKNLCASYYLKSSPIINRCVPRIFSKVVDSSEIMKDESGSYELVTADGDKINAESIFNGTKSEKAKENCLLFKKNATLGAVTYKTAPNKIGRFDDRSLVKFFKLNGVMEMVFKDVTNSAHLILVCMVFAAILALIWIVLLRWLTAIMVWLTILLILGLLGFGSIFSYVRYYEMKNLNVTHEYGLPTVFKVDFEYFLSQQKTWLAFGCTTATIFIITLIIVIFLCSRINLATKLIAEASVAISYMWTILLWPIVPFLLQFLVFAYWVASSLYIASIGEAEFYNDTVAASSNDVNAVLNRVPCNAENGTFQELCSFVKYGGGAYKTFMMFYMLFMFFWLMNFVSALEQMTLAGAFASYYWTWDKKNNMPTVPVLSAMLRSLRYHLGSMAFGSLIIAIVQLIRAILEYVNRKLKSSENSVAKFILKCLRCCFWCLEKFLRFINKNAYIIIAVHGNNFCSAAKDGFFLIMRNVLRAAVLDKVCDFILFLSKLMVAGVIGVIALFWFKGDAPLFDKVVPELNYYLVPVILVIVGAYIIADCFFDVYSMGVDTLFICFLEDLERNDGSEEKPFYMSKTKNLRSLLFERK